MPPSAALPPRPPPGERRARCSPPGRRRPVAWTRHAALLRSARPALSPQALGSPDRGTQVSRSSRTPAAPGDRQRSRRDGSGATGSGPFAVGRAPSGVARRIAGRGFRRRQDHRRRRAPPEASTRPGSGGGADLCGSRRGRRGRLRPGVDRPGRDRHGRRPRHLGRGTRRPGRRRLRSGWRHARSGRAAAAGVFERRRPGRRARHAARDRSPGPPHPTAHGGEASAPSGRSLVATTGWTRST